MPRVSGARALSEIVSRTQTSAYVSALAWAPDSGAVAIADDDGAVAVQQPPEAGPSTVAHHSGGALAVAWAPGPVLAAGGRDGRISLDGRSIEAGREWVERLAWRPDGSLLAAAIGRRVQFWSPTGDCVDVSADLPATVACLAWHPKGILCGVGTYGGVRLLRANGADVVEHLKWTGSVLELAFSPDGRRLAHGNQDASVHFWDLRRSSELEMTGYPTKVRELAWSRDGRWLATGGGESAALWDFHRRRGPAGSRPVELEDHEDLITVLAYQPGGDLLASASRDGLVRLWPPDGGSLPVGRLTLGEPVTALAWSPDGRQIAFGGSRGAVAVACVAIEP